METKKWVLVFLIFSGVFIFAAQPTFAGCEVSSLDALIATGGNAPGTKLSGPITVFYKSKSQLSPEDPEWTQWPADMYFFLRLRKGSDFYQFASGPISVRGPDFDDHAFLVEQFFEETVIPALYPGCDEEGNPECPNVVLKSYDMDVDWEAPGDNGGLFFFIADIVIAIQD